MDVLDYFIWLAMGAIGVLFQAGLKIRAIQDKARKANIQFNPLSYFIEDWLTLSLSLLTVITCLLLVDEFAHFSEYVMKYIRFGFLFIGYTGSDILSRIFSVANKRINNAIDHKATIADEATGNTNNPTPAIKP